MPERYDRVQQRRAIQVLCRIGTQEKRSVVPETQRPDDPLSGWPAARVRHPGPVP